MSTTPATWCAAVNVAALVAELYTRPGAALHILVFVLFGIGASVTWIWWLWWTRWEYPCGHTPKTCTHTWEERNGL